VKSAEFRVKKGRGATAKTPVRKKSLAAREDRRDVAAARKALAESGERIPYEKVRKELGLLANPSSGKAL
jgi:hypothetical protein